MSVQFRWDPDKDDKLRRERGVGYEELLDGKFVGIVGHTTRIHRTLMLIEYDGYIWVVPYVLEGEVRFLKTAYPSRKYTKLYLQGEAP